jgi:hypothetical protein
MSIASYSELQTALGNWLNRSDLSAYFPDFIALGEARIYRDLRIQCMETALSSAISGGVVAVPAGYLALKYAYINTTPVRALQRKDAEWIYQNYPTRASDGEPRYIAREASNFIFGPYPDSAYNVSGIYYKRLSALSNDNATNWFTANAPDILLWAALCEAAPFLKDDARVGLWEKKYEITKERIQREDEQEEFSGSPISVVAR